MSNIMTTLFPAQYRCRHFFIMGLVLLLSLSALIILTKFTFTGNREALYLLETKDWHLFELKDDIFLGEYDRVLFRVEFGDLFSPGAGPEKESIAGPYLKYQWNNKSGDGYILSFLPDNTKFLMTFGRFLDGEGAVPKGLFVGGGLPRSAHEHSEVTLNETGIAYFNGKEWMHLWCNANEAIFSSSPPPKFAYPSNWQYLGSDVLYEHRGELIIKSSHGVVLDNVPVRIDRFVFYKAGNRFFTLMMRIKNIGLSPVGYAYIYGDEPWTGNYGSSMGDVGWTRGRVYPYETRVDTKKYSYAGMFDSGNKVLPREQGAAFTGLANFIQWMGEVHPNYVYFSNEIGKFADEKDKVPLSSKDSRVVVLQWDDRLLQPSQAEIIMLAIGMADSDPKTGFPVKPELQLSKENLDFVIMNTE